MKIPEEFTPKMPFSYPDHNQVDFEYWFMCNYKGDNYIPVQWTSLQLRNSRTVAHKLQVWLNSLDKSKEYFTIIQHDDGIKFKLPFKCKVFGMGSVQDYPLPLICEPHKIEINSVKDIHVSFVGRMTHPIRRKLPQLTSWYFSDRPHDERRYCQIMARSVFALCPRVADRDWET